MSKREGGEVESTGGFGEVVVFPAEDGTAKVQVRLVDGMVWLPQRQIASLYDKDVRTISEHLANIYDEQELDPAATIRTFRIVQSERNRTGSREVARLVEHCSWPALIAPDRRCVDGLLSGNNR